MGNINKINEIALQGILVVQIFYVWGIDFMGPFSPSFGNVYILLVVDYVSKWVGFIQRNIFSRYGAPRTIIIYEGSHFVNKLFAKLLSIYEVRHVMGLAYQPQLNGTT